MSVRRGIAVVHYNRHQNLQRQLCHVSGTAPDGAQIVVCDDGSFVHNDNAPFADEYIRTIEEMCFVHNVPLIKGPNKGVAANKNRALWALQDCHFVAILEDDLMPLEEGWFETYEKAATISGIHHFCRVQDGLVISKAEEFDRFMKTQDLSMIYGKAPRGDLTFLTSEVIRQVGAFHPSFRGAGYAHLEWSERVVDAGLINHPNRWIDVREARNKFEVVGDTEGGRNLEPEEKIKKEIDQNLQTYLKLKNQGEIYHPLVFE